MIPHRTSLLTAVRALALGLLLGASGPLPAATLLKHNFETTNPWPGMAGYQQTAGGTVTATASYATVGTIDTAGTSTASSGLQLTVNSSAATGNWTAGLDSGILSLLTANSRAAGFLTLSFSLSTSSAYPVRVKIESYNSASARTGGLKTFVFPAAADFYQRYAIDLDKMTADGPGTFNPADPKVRISFELDSTANGTGWPAGAAHVMKVDNVNFSTPKYYVKPASIGGSDSKSGVDEANALATVQAAINKTLSGDNIIAIMQDNTAGGNDYAQDTYNGEMVSITKAGLPDAWIVCKNYPGHTPALKSNGWQAFKVHGNAAYVEIRGLIVRGQTFVDANGDRQLNPAYVSDIGKGRSSSSGNGIAANSPAHHVRVADNTMEYFGGSNGGSADRLTFENNLIRYNCWFMVYAGSGISFAFASDWELGANYRLLIRNNTIYGNECMIPWWGNGGNNYSDGNGIIIDSMTAGYSGKTLIQNNVVFNNGGGGIHILKAENVDVVHNTTYHNSASGVLAYPDTDTQSFASTDGNWIKNVRFANNISFARRNSTGSSSLNETAMGVASFDRATIFQNRNLYAGGDSTPLLTGANFSNNTDLGRAYNAANLFLAPSTDPAVADFRLRATAAARNYGTVVDYRGVLDHDSTPRSLTGLTDSGAYQTVAGLAYSPIFSPAAGSYTTALNVTLTSDTAGATIVYTVDGTVPTVNAAGVPTNGAVYTAAIPVSTTKTLKAIAWKDLLATSPAATAIYDYQNLTALPVPLQLYTRSGSTGVPTTGGIFSGTIVIQPVTNTPGALMRYTTNGSDPTESTGTAAVYTGYSVTDYANLRYRAFKPGRAPSAIATGAFTVRAKIGNTADGTSLASMGANVMRFVRFQATEALSAGYVFGRVAGVVGGYRAAIYDEASSAPAARLAVSSLVTTSTAGWLAFPLTARVTLKKDSYYWLAIWSDDPAAGIFATATGGTVRELGATFSSTWPNPVGTTNPVAGTANYALYATNMPPNLAPVVNAGPDQSIAPGGTANLAGTATDDSVPLAPGALMVAWTQISGPGAATFANPSSAATTVTFSAGGDYVLRLTGRDALLTSTDTVAVSVSGAATSQVVYRETFGNTSGAQQTHLAALSGWRQFTSTSVGAAVFENTSTTDGGVSNNAGNPSNLTNVNAGTSPSDSLGYVFVRNAREYLVFTEEFALDRFQRRLDSFSWLSSISAAGASNSQSLAVRIAGQWYVGPIANNLTQVTDVAGFVTSAALFTANFATTPWRTLTATTGAPFAIGASEVPLPPGNIDAFGVFVTTASTSVVARFDSFTVNATLISPAVHWSFEDPAPLVDGSALGLALSTSNTAPGYTNLPLSGPGAHFPRVSPITGLPSDRAATFTGAEWFQTASAGFASPGPALTVEAFLTTPTLATGVGTHMIASRSLSTGGQRGWFFGELEGQLRFGSSADGANFTNLSSAFPAGQLIVPGKDYYAAAVYDAGTVTFYLQNLTDGEPLRTSVVTGFRTTLFASTAPLKIGAYDADTAAANRWLGLLDSVSITAAALPAADLQIATYLAPDLPTTPLELWRRTYFTTTELVNSALDASRWGHLADPDHDGLSNFLEYALDLDPLTFDASAACTVTADLDGVLSLSFLRASAELTYEVEGSSDLAIWELLETNPGNVGETVIVPDNPPVTGGNRFLRLRVIQP